MNIAQLHPDRTRRRSALRTIGNNLCWMLASRGMMAALSLIYIGLAARTLGIADFGRFALITGAAQTLSTIVAFQSWQVIVTYGIEAADRGDNERLGRLLRAGMALDIFSMVAGSLLAVILLSVWGDRLGIGPGLQRAAMLFAIVDILTIRSTPLGILRLRDRYPAAAIADSVIPLTRFVGAFLALLIHPSVEGFLIAWGLSEILTTAAYWRAASRDGDVRLMLNTRGTRQVLADHPGIVRFALSTNASTTLGLCNKQLPLLIIGAILGPAAAGTFRLAAQIAQALAKTSQMVSRVVFPEAVRALRQAPNAALRFILMRTLGVTMTVSLLILSLIGLVGRTLVDLIAGQHFTHSAGVLLCMSAAGCVELSTSAVDTLLTARARAGIVFMARAAGALLILTAGSIVLPEMGVMGMASAVLAGTTTALIVMLIAAWRLSSHRRERD